MEQQIQRLLNRLSNIEYILCCICNKLNKVDNEELAILSLIGKIINDIEGRKNGIDTANAGISTLSLDVAGVGQGVDDANEAISNIDCGSCDLTEVYKKLDRIILDIPNIKCRFPRPPKEDEEKEVKQTKTKKK